MKTLIQFLWRNKSSVAAATQIAWKYTPIAWEYLKETYNKTFKKNKNKDEKRN